MAENLSHELLNLFESLLRAQLHTIRQLRKSEGREEQTPEPKGRSQMSIVYDILTTARQPMHVDDIIAQADLRFKVRLDKESLVSALSKRVKRQNRFIKTAPNTFALLTKEPAGGPR